MNKQVFFGAQPKAELVAPLANSTWMKPTGGFWTSSHTPESEFASAWAEWCTWEDFRTELLVQGYTLTPKADAKVLVINTEEDLKAILDQHSVLAWGQRRVMDYEALAKEWDGIRVTEDGVAATKWCKDDLNGWDLESTVWFRWCFEESEGVAL